MMTDLYQLTMMQGYFKASGRQSKRAVFDLFFRDNGIVNYAIACGLHQAVEFIESIEFSDSDIAYLCGTGLFSADFLDYLKDFRFRGDIDAVTEGTVIFPQEPILIVKASLIEAQFVETALLNIIGHQTLIAAKASRIVTAAAGSEIVEYGLRRAQGPDAGIYGVRAAYIGGCGSTSNVFAAKKFGLPLKGTHAHSWVQSFNSELEAFREYARIYPDECSLLVDTYDTLRSGVPNAIKVFDELKKKGFKPVGIRLDSGDLAYLSKRAREMLDAAGHKEAKILASGDIDENVIGALREQGARIDAYGVGTKMITGADMPHLGAVYKLSSITETDLSGKEKTTPKMKLSDNIGKMTLPAEKDLFRLYDKDGYAVADLITLKGETVEKPLKLTHPTDRWKSMVLEDFTVKKLLVPVFREGKRVYNFPSVTKIAQYAKADLDTFWSEYKRITRPQFYKVNISDKLYDLRQKLINNA
jgi:nicotinate phosphoribosyltransferase